METSKGWSRRDFLQTVGSSVPTLNLMLGGVVASTPLSVELVQSEQMSKFRPIDLTPFFTASPVDFGPHEAARSLSGGSDKDGLIRTPAGKQDFRGIPFWFGVEGVDQKKWVVVGKKDSPWMRNSLEIPLNQAASFICVAGFCEWDENETPPPNQDMYERVGQLLAEAKLVYSDGTEKSLPIRRRFETFAPSTSWGHLSFASLPHLQDQPRRLTEKLSDGTQWGELQTAVWDNSYPSGPDGRSIALLWIACLENPEPARPIRALRLQAVGEDPYVLCGLTLFTGHENPLRLEPLGLYRVTLPEAVAGNIERWKADVDLGVVARSFVMNRFEPEAWLVAPDAGLGSRNEAVAESRHLYLELAASSEATLRLKDNQTGKQYLFDLAQIVPGREVEARPAGTKIEIVENDKVWLLGQVLDTATGKPTPARLAFRSSQGRYIPPYGHRTEINDAWFQDYGADVKLMDTSFAYVDGTFQVELPVGEVFVEMTKGFEYQPVRKRLKIEAQQRELNLEVSRHADFRAQGWVSADTHVHFLSPSTAILEGQAEGLNLINLLAAQWGDLFTNVGDLSHGPLTSKDGQMMVRVGTENRQHLLGHLGLLGGQGRPVFPMSASGPSESYLGDPLWNSLADWADTCRQRDGLVVAVHFPYPTAELAADIVMGKIDAVELYPYGDQFNTLRFLDWYRYLNCGYRLAAVGGTDKMGAYMPAGTNRTYAYLGKEEFSFESFARSVRNGRTFMSTGPLLQFHVDGQMPGGEIKLGATGGTVEVMVEGKSHVPFHRLEVVWNGKVVASREDQGGSRDLNLREKIPLSGPGWLAARCASRYGPTTAWSLGIQAHTSPVYVTRPGQELFSTPAATYFLSLIDGAESWVKNLATRPDTERLARVLRLFADARERLHQKMHQHGIAALITSRPVSGRADGPLPSAKVNMETLTFTFCRRSRS